MKRILVAEDEKSIREFIVINLERNGFDVVQAENGKQAIQAYTDYDGDIDIALLDIMMPEVDGLEVCKFLREKSNTIGIVMLTAKTQEMDKVTGLLVGADDYVTKPFSPSELMARVDAIYRRVMINKNSERKKEKDSDLIILGDFALNLRSRTLSKNGKNIELTQVEFQLMEYFFANPDVALDRSSILKYVWGDLYYGDDKVVDVNIRRLRMKVEDEPSRPLHLTTIWGLGYKWIP
ncbi:MAG: response regulator transcription factor [Clostridia bacterium]|nr:response regulator transcription factor [Clostridia bacterium]